MPRTKAPEPGPVRILIVDDHPVVRNGLRTALATVEEMEVVGEAAAPAQGLQLLRTTRPDVVLLDLRLQDEDGFDLLAAAKERGPRPGVLILSMFCDPATVRRAVAGHADGYLLKESPLEEVISAVRQVARGGQAWDPRATAALADELNGHADTFGRIAALNYQEKRIVERVARGLTNRQIAAEMGLSDKTVRNYLSRIMEDLGAKRRAEVASLYTRASGSVVRPPR